MGGGVSGCLRHSPNPHGARGLVRDGRGKKKSQISPGKCRRLQLSRDTGCSEFSCLKNFGKKQKQK